MSGDSDRLRVGLLGALRVTRGGVDLPIPGARLRGLLVRLAVAGGRPVAPGRLAEALWPGEQPTDPANALQSLISRLRRLLGGGDTVTQAEGGYRLSVRPDDVDVLRFERLAAVGRERLRAGDPAGAAGPLGEAVALTTGVPPPATAAGMPTPSGVVAGTAPGGVAAGTGPGSVVAGTAQGGDVAGTATGGVAAGGVAPELSEVAPAQAVRLGQILVEAVADLAEAETGLGAGERAAARLTGLLAEHPLNERIAALLIDALTALGRQADALAVYERVRAALGDQLGTDPGAALRERHLLLLRGTPPLAPVRGATTVPEGGSDPPPTNLPEPLTSFVGRADDLARIDALLAGGRLVTVLGPGGAGKTRLAVEAARRRAGGFRDGVWLVDLASVTEPAKVGAAVVAAAGLRGSALFETANRVWADGRGDVDVLADRLYGRRILLVVDNCEHLIDAVAHLVSALLVRCPQLRVLTTSREPLAVDGESLVPLGPLGLPAAGADPGDAVRAPAVRLFTERAAAVRPGFAVDAGTVGDVVRIVRGLDGLPLALELAAARLRTLGLAELADGLSDRFRLLTSGSRTAQPRHRTLRAVIAWSWNLLADDERALAERVAVLPGGVTVASAAVLAAGSATVADLLAALVDRSLLQLAPGGRYRMLETIREYGIERLAEQGALDGVRGLAARHLAGLVAGYDAMLRTAAQMEALRMMRAEYDNTLAALRHFCDAGDAPAAVSLALDLCWYWQMFGRHADAAFWLSAALAVPGDVDPVAADCAEAVLVLNRTGTEPGLLTETAAQRRDRVRALADRLAAHPELPGPAGAIAAFILYFAGDNDLAEERVNRLVDGPDRWLSAMAHMMRAQIAENNGDVARMGRAAAIALDGFRAIGDRWGQATVLPLRALIRQYDGDLDGAFADLRAARAFAAEFGSLDIADEIFIDLRWADLHMRRGEPDEARAALAQARARADRSDSTEMRLLVDALEAGMMLWLGDLDRATELIDRAAAGIGLGGDSSDDVRLLLGGDHGCAIVGAVRASLAVRQDDPETAEKALAVAYPAAVQTQDMPILALVAVAAGGLAVQRGLPREAAALLGAAARLRGAHDHTALDVVMVATRARAALGEEGYGEAYAAGWNLETAAAQSLIDPARLAIESGPSVVSGPPGVGA
ncbi:AfsR/SARP family transcriptional regulator [Actinoplanes sp. CA-252034]|uniref:AfsR/SARP family transcriptional regulator n=1 Tax=Actinoplanes sp. CA-252034 TaxID=3239906 RepID=UPI003D99CC6B